MKPLNVGELIKKLQDEDPDSLVCIYDANGVVRPILDREFDYKRFDVGGGGASSREMVILLT